MRKANVIAAMQSVKLVWNFVHNFKSKSKCALSDDAKHKKEFLVTCCDITGT